MEGNLPPIVHGALQVMALHPRIRPSLVLDGERAVGRKQSHMTNKRRHLQAVLDCPY